MSCPVVEKLRIILPIIAALLTVLTAGCESNGSLAASPSFANTALDSEVGKTESGIVRGKQEVTVTVAGAVVKPGVYVLNSGANVAEAIVEAGGLTDQATLSTLNLKSSLRDKMVLTVPKVSFPTSRKAASPIPRVSNSPVITNSRSPNHTAPPVPAVRPAKVDSILKVIVKGAVSKPGTYYLLAGDPIASAIIAAGGPALNANMGAVGLNEPLRQGMILTVPTVQSRLAAAPKKSGGTPMPSPSQTAGSESIDINAATSEQLQRLPGIGPSLASRIVTYRKEVGAFRAPEQLMDVKGISPEKFALIQPLIQTK